MIYESVYEFRKLVTQTKTRLNKSNSNKAHTKQEKKQFNSHILDLNIATKKTNISEFQNLPTAAIFLVYVCLQ